MKHQLAGSFACHHLFNCVLRRLAQKTVDEIIARVNGDIILKSEFENAKSHTTQ